VNRKTLLIISGCLLVVGVLFGIRQALSIIENNKKKQGLVGVVEAELKKRDERLSQLNKHIEDLSREKSMLAEKEAELSRKFQELQSEIQAKLDKEAALKEKAEELSTVNKKLSESLVDVKSIQEKYRLTAEQAQKELEKKQAEHELAKQQKSIDEIIQVTKLKKELEALNKEKAELSDMAYELSNELDQARQEVDYFYSKGTVLPDFHPWAGYQDRYGESFIDEEYAVYNPRVYEKFKQHYNLALEYDSTSNFRKAIEQYQKALNLIPDDADTHYNMAVIYDDHLKMKNKAVYHYRKYVELSPNSPDRVKVESWIIKAIEDMKWQRKVN
jgi:tetratricopeptide (TPR) repeat protein